MFCLIDNKKIKYTINIIKNNKINKQIECWKGESFWNWKFIKGVDIL